MKKIRGGGGGGKGYRNLERSPQRAGLPRGGIFKVPKSRAGEWLNERKCGIYKPALGAGKHYVQHEAPGKSGQPVRF